MGTSFLGDRRPLQQGTVLADYTIVSCIGEGGTSLVYSAKDRISGEFVVIKEYYPVRRSIKTKSSYDTPFERDGVRLLPKRGISARYLKGAQQFQREQEISDALRFERGSNYSGLLPQRYLPVPEDPAFQGTAAAYAVMKTAAGETLSDFILRERDGKNYLPALLEILCGVLSRLSRFHSRGYLHLDITPRNIYLLTMEGTRLPVFLDYGSAQEKNDIRSDALTCSSGFSAPELGLEEPEKAISAATDLFSVGAVFYYAVLGKPFFIGETESEDAESGETWFLRRLEENETARVLPEGVRLTLARLFAKALNEEPEERYADCASMRKALEELRDVIADRGFHPAVLYRFSLNALKARQEKNPIDAGILPEVRRTVAGGEETVCADLLEAVSGPENVNYLLVSAGGSGKTTGMIYAADSIAENYPHTGDLAVYIPAIEIVADRTGNCILKYIFNHLIGWTGTGNEDYENRLHHLMRAGFEKTGRTLTVFVDGVNESSSAERILSDIEALHRLFPGTVRFVVSSRSAGDVSLSEPCLLSLLPIRRERVLNYLSDSVKLTTVQNDATLLQLLTNPLYLTMYKRTGYVLRYKKYPNWQILTDDREEITSVAELLWNFNQSLIIRSIGRQVTDPPCDTPNTETYFSSVAVHRYLLPAVCFRIFASGGNSVNYRQFKAIYEEADAEIREEKPSVGDDLPHTTPITWLRKFSEEEGTLLYSTNAADDICDIHAAHETLFSFYVALYLYNHCLAGGDPEKRRTLFSEHRYSAEILTLFDGISRQESFALSEDEKRSLLAAAQAGTAAVSRTSPRQSFPRPDEVALPRYSGKPAPVRKTQPQVPELPLQPKDPRPAPVPQPQNTQQNLRPQNTQQNVRPQNTQQNARPQNTQQNARPQNTQQNLQPKKVQPGAQPKKVQPGAQPKKAQPGAQPQATPQDTSKKKLQRIGMILFLLASVFLLISGYLIIRSGVKGKNEQTGNNTEAAATAESAPAQTAPTNGSTTTAKSGDQSQAASSEQGTVTTTTAETTSFAQPEEKTPDQMTAAELLTYFNDTLNQVKTDRVGFRKSKSTAASDLQLSNAAANTVVGFVKDTLLPDRAKVTSVNKGENSTDVISPAGKSYVSSLTAADITSITCTKSANGYVITVAVKSETDPAAGSAMSRVFDFITVEDVANVYAPKVGATVAEQDIELAYSGCTATLTVGADGRIETYKTYVKCNMQIGNASIKKVVTFNTDLSLTLVSTADYTAFVY